jgi:hypothetical protein
VTNDVRSVSTTRGRARELDEYATGTATVVLNDNDRTFDPSYSGSPYYGQLTPMRRIHIAWNGTPIFHGWIEDWTVSYEPGDRLSYVTVECVDAFAILANQELSEIVAAYSGDTSGTRITRVLDRTEVNFPAIRSIDAGTSILGATTLGDNALSYLQACTRAEAGYLFTAADGTLVFRGRLAVLNLSTDIILSDDPAAGIPYRNLTQRSSADLLYTRVTAESETTTVEVTSTNAAASDEYLIRTLSLGPLFTVDNTQTQNLADYYLTRFSTVEQRFQSATFNAAALTAAQVAALVGLDLTDVVTVERAPLNVGATIERLSLVDQISHNISHGSWSMDLTFANADTRLFIALDGPVLGALDAYRLAF